MLNDDGNDENTKNQKIYQTEVKPQDEKETFILA
jgi:hypothetical protein